MFKYLCRQHCLICSFDSSFSVFTNNTATVDGTVLVIRFGAAFEGTNNFTGNTGGGVVLVLARMESKGNLWFEGNIAQYGAGISMQDSCLVSLL